MRLVRPGFSLLAERHNNRLLIERVDVLREAFRDVKTPHSFQVDAIVNLPEHLHCLWTLPPGASDFSTRWSLIKAHFFPVDSLR